MADENQITPVFDWKTGDFAVDAQGRVKTASGNYAVEQIVIKAQQTVRAAFLIYADPDDEENDHKYGSEAKDVILRRELSQEARNSELQRAVKEALIYDPWVLEVYDVTVYQQVENGVTKDYVDFKLQTIFDEINLEGVALNG
jgi:hypothetical protein